MPHLQAKLQVGDDSMSLAIVCLGCQAAKLVFLALLADAAVLRLERKAIKYHYESKI